MTNPLNKTTVNMFNRRNVSIYFDTVFDSAGNESVHIEFGLLRDGEAADEFLVRYRVGKLGGFYFSGSCYGDVEEFPNYIESEVDFRRLAHDFAWEITRKS